LGVKTVMLTGDNRQRSAAVASGAEKCLRQNGCCSRPPCSITGHSRIEALIREQGWRALPEYERIGAIYDFVRDAIPFGYNRSDDLPASQVLADGIGQCNTKGTLLMALLRGSGIPCRLHGFTIDKALQKGAVTGIAYLLAPRSILHSWVEIYAGRWVEPGRLHPRQAVPAAAAAALRRPPGGVLRLRRGHARLAEPAGRLAGRRHLIQKDGINHDFGSQPCTRGR
jgi:hypothetical protein